MEAPLRHSHAPFSAAVTAMVEILPSAPATPRTHRTERSDMGVQGARTTVGQSCSRTTDEDTTAMKGALTVIVPHDVQARPEHCSPERPADLVEIPLHSSEDDGAVIAEFLKVLRIDT